MKKFIKNILVNSRVLRYAKEITPPCIAILKYHSIQDTPELFDNTIGGIGITHSTSIFKEQMGIIAKHFNPLTMDDVLLFIRGKKKIPKGSIVVTFDDGYADNLEIAAPIMDYYGIRATIYVMTDSIEAVNPPWFVRLRHAIWTTRKKEWYIPTDGNVLKLQNRNDRIVAMRFASKQCARLVGIAQDKAVINIEHALDVKPLASKNNFMLNWDQIRKLHQAGHVIGAHTRAHPNVACLGNEDLLKELIESKHILEKGLGSPVIHFSYPNPALVPHFTEQTIAIVKQVGYKTSVTSYPAGPVYSNDNPMSLKRVWVPNHKSAFMWNLEWTLLGQRI